MEPQLINYIKTNSIIYQYLRENSSWYKELMRNPLSIKKLEEESKKYYKQTPSDKINQLSESINLLTTLIDVIK